MAYPYSAPANNKADATVTATDHPAHHNALANCLIDLLAELGSGPKGGSADLTARLSALDSLVALKAALASPAFTGNPTAPTPTAGDNDTSIATTAFVAAAIAALTGTYVAQAKSTLPSIYGTPSTVGVGRTPTDAFIQVGYDAIDGRSFLLNTARTGLGQTSDQEVSFQMLKTLPAGVETGIGSIAENTQVIRHGDYLYTVQKVTADGLSKVFRTLPVAGAGAVVP